MSSAAGTAREGRLELRRSGWLLLAAILMCCACLLPAAAFGASTTVRVSATLRPWLKFSAVPQVGSYQVDAAALRRGYVDLPASLAVEVATNLREEVRFDLVSAGPETIQVLDGGATAPGSLRFAAATSNAPVARNFGLRILLPPGAGEGTYPLSFQVAAAML